MNQYAIATAGFPTLKILAHSVTGALAKAESVNSKLFGVKVESATVTFRLVKRNVR